MFTIVSYRKVCADDVGRLVKGLPIRKFDVVVCESREEMERLFSWYSEQSSMVAVEVFEDGAGLVMGFDRVNELVARERIPVRMSDDGEWREAVVFDGSITGVRPPGVAPDLSDPSRDGVEVGG